jgi:hypothetical protein
MDKMAWVDGMKEIAKVLMVDHQEDIDIDQVVETIRATLKSEAKEQMERSLQQELEETAKRISENGEKAI